MAIENNVILNGQIKEKKESKIDGKITRIDISLQVLRRPNSPIGNIKGQLRFDLVPIVIRKKEQIEYLTDRMMAKGDLLEVSGVYNTIIANKYFFCPNCGQKNVYEGSIAYVTPISLELKQLHPKQIEIVELQKEEIAGKKEDIIRQIRKKKRLAGKIVGSQILEQTESGGVLMQVTTQEETTDEEATEWMQRMSDISNRIYIMGNLCSDPKWFENEAGGKTSTYQIGVNRKYFVREDDPSVRADFPYIKSINDQAVSDQNALMQGSLVFVEGAIQKRDNFTIRKECAYCGAECEVNGNTLEIVPYSVEYLRNCNSSEYDFDLDDDLEPYCFDDNDENEDE